MSAEVAPVLPREVECWTYDGDALVGHRRHDYLASGYTPGGIQVRCTRCGRIDHRPFDVA